MIAVLLPVHPPARPPSALDVAYLARFRRMPTYAEMKARLPKGATLSRPIWRPSDDTTVYVEVRGTVRAWASFPAPEIGFDTPPGTPVRLPLHRRAELLVIGPREGQLTDRQARTALNLGVQALGPPRSRRYAGAEALDRWGWLATWRRGNLEIQFCQADHHAKCGYLAYPLRGKRP